MTVSNGNDVAIRTGPRPGDLGMVLGMHGTVYAREYGFNEEFEAHVASGLASFAARLANPDGGDPGRLWIAEIGDEPVGTVALTMEDVGVGQLRWFLVRPDARGGLGRRLLHVVLAEAAARELDHVFLWTVDGLPAAARLYERAGFRCVQRRPVRQWGHDLVELRYDLPL